MRFPEFSGEWIEKRFEDIAKFSKGKGISKLDISENGATECIRYGQLYTDYSEVISEVISKTDIENKDLVLSEENDVIIPASGETQIDIATASCVMKSGVALGGDLNIMKSNENGVFLSYYLNNAKKLDIAKLAQGISVVHLYASQLKYLKLNIPSLDEQKRVSKFLTILDERISTQSKIIEHQESLMKGFIQQIFSQQLRFKDKNGKDFPDWKSNRLGEIAEIVGGGTPETTKPEYWNGEYNWFTPTEIKQKYIEGSNRKITALGIQKSSARILPEKTLLFTSRATIGDVGITKVECATNQGFQSFLPNGKYDTEFLYYWIKINKKKFIRKSSGSTFIEISKGEIQKVRIQMPSYQEQIRIANFLSSIDDRLETEKQVLKQYKQQKKHLLQNLFV